MEPRLKKFRFDPLPSLLNSNHPALIYFSKRDLLDTKVPDILTLWSLPEPSQIIRRQQSNGSWKYPGKHIDARDQNGYDQIETFRNLSYLIEKYGFTKNHSTIQKAANFFFSCQNSIGDFRGIYGNQYATTYSPMIGELLIKAGYGDDQRVVKSLEWLMNIRQEDGGWAIPLRTMKANYYDAVHGPLIEPDRTKPFSHLITGCALRALSIHPDYRKLPEVIHAGKLLMTRIFERDKYSDRSAVNFWIGFSYPYWFTDLLTTLDSLSNLDFSEKEPKITEALDWFIKKQAKDGTWKNLHLLRGRDKQQYLWVTLQICRVCSRFLKSSIGGQRQ